MNLLPIPQKVCSPVYRCFPPRSTRCLICGNTSAEQCPLKKLEKQGE